MGVVVILLLVAFTYVLLRLFMNALYSTKHAASTFSIDGIRYNYTIGDDLTRYNADSMRAIDIDLPKEFPHLLFDSRAKRDVVGTKYYYSSDQKLSLEGNFDKAFTFYAPKGYEQLALTVATPDFLHILLDCAKEYDVELYRSHLRLISSKKLHKHPARQDAIKKAAKAVLVELNHKLKSWNSQDSKNAHTMILKMDTDQVVLELGLTKMRSVKIRSSIATATIGWGFLAFLFYYTGVYVTSVSGSSNGVWLMNVTAFMCFPIAFLFTMYRILKNDKPNQKQ
jgi:hypothetical protein